MGQGPGRWEKFRVVVARPSRMGRVGVRARHTFTRQGNKHPTRKQASDKETGTQQGNRHSTRKQALNKETSTQQGNRHSTRKQALNKETGTQQGNKHSTRKQALNKQKGTYSQIFSAIFMLHMLDPYFFCRTSVFW
jgi:hypothetical protein